MIDVGKIIRQGAPPHGSHRLGLSQKSSIAGAGCMLTSLVHIARVVAGPIDLDILDAQERILRADGFAGGSLILDRAAPALGIVKTYRGSFSIDIIRAEIKCGRPVMIGIDFLAGEASSGFSGADHFVDVVDAGDGTITIADPAVGSLVELNLVSTKYASHDAHLAEMVLFTRKAA